MLMDDDRCHSPMHYDGFMPDHNTRRREIGMQAQQGDQGHPGYRHPGAEQYPPPAPNLRLNNMFDARRPHHDPQERANPGPRRRSAPKEMHQGQQQLGSEDGSQYEQYQDHTNHTMYY